MTDPIDHAKADPSTNKGPRSPNKAQGFTNSLDLINTTPPSPNSTPAQPRTVSRSPLGQKASSNASQSGVVATRTAARLDGILFSLSATVISPLPPTNIRPPTSQTHIRSRQAGR